MSGLSDILSSGGEWERPEDMSVTHPKGWEPGVAWDGSTGVLSTGPVSEAPTDWDSLLRVWGLDPKVYEAVEPIQYRAWDAAIGNGETKRMFYYKANIIMRRHGATLDVDEMLAEIKKFKPRKVKDTTGDNAFIWCVADLQVGKSDGDGTPGTLIRFLNGVTAIEARVAELRKQGRSIGTLYVAGLGDCIENVKGFYCVSADTPILTRDLQWVPAGSLQPGDGLYAVDEHGTSSGRRFTESAVVSNVVENLPALRLSFGDGSTLVCTPEHPLLSAGSGPKPKKSRWTAASAILGEWVAKPVEVWTEELSKEAGWLAGMFDGEGCFSRANNGGTGDRGTLQVSQKPGPVLDRLETDLKTFGFDFSSFTHPVTGVVTLKILGGYSEQLRLLGSIRPGRLIDKLRFPQMQSKWVKVVGVADAGFQPIARMETSSHTYIANGFASHNSQQLFRADLNLTQQIRLVRRLLVESLKRLIPLFDKVVMVSIPGNHGEASRSDGGKSDTDFSDNWDVECFAIAYDVLREIPGFAEKLSFVCPQGQNLTVTLDICGTIVTLAHGHQFKSRASGGAMRWWADQAHGLQEPGKSTLLLAGHLHHLCVEQDGFKTFMQAPALDGGSDWFRERTGKDGVPGVLTLVVGGGTWSDLAVL